MPGITSLTSFKTDVKTLDVNLKMCKMGHIMSKSWWGAGDSWIPCPERREENAHRRGATSKRNWDQKFSKKKNSKLDKTLRTWDSGILQKSWMQSTWCSLNFLSFNKLPADPVIGWDHLGTAAPGVSVGGGARRGCWFCTWTEGCPLGIPVPSYSPVSRVPEEETNAHQHPVTCWQAPNQSGTRSSQNHQVYGRWLELGLKK